jgi:SAM-dependent methyltransferase
MDASAAQQAREELLECWEQAAPRWASQATRVRDTGMPASMWMIDHLALQPGHRVLELAAGPGDTGFLAAELIQPGGTLICSDAAPAMLDVARERARALGIDNVEFSRLQLEWIDLPTAAVNAVLCRWGLMFAIDPSAAAREMRRVLRQDGRLAVAVWDAPDHNPWATVPQRALVELGHLEPPDPSGPGMFTLASPQRLMDLLEDAGFVEVVVDGVELPRHYDDVDSYVQETAELSNIFGRHWRELDDVQRAAVRERMASLAEPFTAGSGRLEMPGRSLVAAASA